MFKVKLDKNIQELDAKLVKHLLDLHRPEKMRIATLKKYFRNKNNILGRTKPDGKPNNKMPHGYAFYITTMATGFFIGKPVEYTSANDKMLERIKDVLKYNDEHDNNTTLAKNCSVCGYGFDLMYIDEDAKIRFKSIEPDEMIYIVDNTLDENPLFAIRYFEEYSPKLEKDITKLQVFTRTEVIEYDYSTTATSHKLKEIERRENYFDDVPVIPYLNNDEGMGDFERVIEKIDSYDKAQSDSANDFEYFTDAFLMIFGAEIDGETADELRDRRILNFPDDNARAEFLEKDIKDTATENYKTRIDNDIHKFSMVPNLTDKEFSGDASGESMKYKLMGLTTLRSIKEQKFKKGVFRRFELICNYFNRIANENFDYTDMSAKFTTNVPKNEKELVEMVKALWGILSEQTAIEQIPFVEDAQEEIKRKKEEQSDKEVDYQFNDANNVARGTEAIGNG